VSPHVTLGQRKGFSLEMGKLMLLGRGDQVTDTILTNSSDPEGTRRGIGNHLGGTWSNA